MAGTEQYDVCIVFSVNAIDDDTAREKITSVLPKNNLEMAWAWIYTSQSNKGEENKC